ncbi:hypothetical protein GGE12_003822 [Rhizobium mongolense]|uniref:Uncharacterized protein n=1 Tax=Rhizobium mongolense TaxID=57676 RepID=A0A7W6RQ69_9HYPH|nr:hypothetical protein [Rhizobium mongolense]
MAKVSAAIYLSPPVTMLWGWMLFSEPLTTAMFAGRPCTLRGRTSQNDFPCFQVKRSAIRRHGGRWTQTYSIP